MKYIFYALCTFLCIACVQKESIDIDLSKEINTPEHYVVAKTERPLIIDGKGLEREWQNAPFSKYFVDIEGVKTPKYNTQVKMLWDEHYLYVFANLEEPNIWGDLYQRDTVIYYNNDFEIFIDPSGDTYNYGEIEVNALNTVWDLMLDKPYRTQGKADDNWNLDSLKTAVDIKGTLNNPNDTDTSWSVEMAIPLVQIMQLKNSKEKRPVAGEQWRVNFSRVNWDHDILNGLYDRKKKNGKYLPEYNWVWSNQGVIAMHEPEKWGFIQFSDKATAAQNEFIPEKDLKYKLVAYALFRHARYGSLKHLFTEKEGYTQRINAVLSRNEAVSATFAKTKTGFVITFLHPKSKSLYKIDQSGWVDIS